jgi:NADH dehydrogenase FAD-containing subunit
MRSISHPEIFAVGDSSVFEDYVGLNMRMACATAMPMAAHAVDNLITMQNGNTPKPFAFGYVLRCISLGRRDGLVQFVEPDDTPKERIITGRLGAFIKELIVVSTIVMPHWERRLPGLYFWVKSIKGQSKQDHDYQKQVPSWNSLNNSAR